MSKFNNLSNIKRCSSSICTITSLERTFIGLIIEEHTSISCVIWIECCIGNCGTISTTSSRSNFLYWCSTFLQCWNNWNYFYAKKRLNSTFYDPIAVFYMVYVNRRLKTTKMWFLTSFNMHVFTTLNSLKYCSYFLNVFTSFVRYISFEKQHSFWHTIAWLDHVGHSITRSF